MNEEICDFGFAICDLGEAPVPPRPASPLRESGTARFADQTKPALHHRLDFHHLRSRQCTQAPQELARRHSQHALDIERAGRQKTNLKAHLELRTPRSRSVRHDLDQRVIPVVIRDAHDEHRAHLCGEAQVRQPNLPTLRLLHGPLLLRPTCQRLPPPRKLDPPRPRGRRRHRRAHPLCEREIAPAPRRPPPAILRSSVVAKLPGSHLAYSPSKPKPPQSPRQDRNLPDGLGAINLTPRQQGSGGCPLNRKSPI